MSHKKPQPRISPQTYNRWPVCGQISYSPDDVHPHCSVKQVDAAGIERLRRENPTEKAEKSASDFAPLQRVCQNCGEFQQMRRRLCGCGHTFAVLARPPNSESEPS